MEWETILFELKQNVGVITLNRPERFNALNFQLGDDLIAALEECRMNSQIRAVILKGAGKAFCSGGDLAMAREFSILTHPRLSQLIKIKSILTHPTPIDSSLKD